MTNSNNRIEWLDTAKGIGVVLVILGHLWYSCKYPIVNRFIYSFHMPMFFTLSGFVKKNNKDVKKGEAIKKLLWRLLIPAYLGIILLLPFYFNNVNQIDIKTFLKLVFYLNGELPYNLPCWFFIVLFEVKLIDLFIGVFDKTIIKSLYGVLFFGAAWILYVKPIYVPFGLNRCVMALAFFYFGSVLSDLYKKIDNKIVMSLVGIVSCVIFTFAALHNDKVTMYGWYLGKYWLFVLSGISGTIALCLVSMLVSKYEKIFKSIAKKSVIIVCTHYVFVTMFEKILYLMNLRETLTSCVLAVVYTAILLAMYVMLVNNKKVLKSVLDVS